MERYKGNYIGQPVPETDALYKVTGEMEYTDDMKFRHLLYGKVLGSPHAHARILSIDTSEAEKLEGVRAVITYEDSPEVLYNRAVRWIGDPLPKTEEVLSREIRFAGEKVAAVAADTEEIAAKAVKLIRVEYEVLPIVTDPRAAVREESPKLYESGNILHEQHTECGDVDRAIEEAEVQVVQTVSTSMIHHGAIEPHICIAQWKRGDELEVWGPVQAVHRLQVALSHIFKVPYSKMLIHGSHIGGSFGGKDGVMIEPLALLLSKKSGGYPVKIRYDRKESMLCTFTRHAMQLDGRMGVDRDGTIKGFDITTYMSVGPYCGGSINVMQAMCGKMFKVYAVPNARYHGYACYTNTPVGGAMRGFGSPKIFFELELLVNKAANAIGMDQVELRRKNLIEPYDMDPAAKDSLRSAKPKACLIQGAEIFEWEKKKRECREKSNEKYAYGCGVAVAMHGNGVAPFAPDITVSEISLSEDGSVLLRTASTDHGAGTYTLLRQIVAETLQIPMEQVEYTHSDTRACPYDMGSGASRNTWSAGMSAWQVAQKMLRTLKKTAAEILECTEEEIVLREDGAFCDTKGRQVSRADISAHAYLKQRRKLIEVVSYNSDHNAGSYGVHFCTVRVDRETGETKVLDYAAVYDIGSPLNPMLLTGQIEGAIGQGIGMALFEGIQLDAEGRVLNANFKKYRMPRTTDMPKIQIEFVDNYEEGGPFGGKSIGESSINPVAPCIVGAINNALGTDLHDLPVTPEKIKAALQ